MKNDRSSLKFRGSKCLNCNQDLDISEKYCHHCGQLNSTKKLTFEDFFTEFFAGIFAYDSRLYKTLEALFFNPGKISKDYVAGKRTRYANPYKFYLSVSIIFFILWGFSNNFSDVEGVDLREQDEISSAINPTDSLAVDSIPEGNDFFGFFNNDLSLEDIYVPEKELEKMPFLESSETKIKIFWKQYYKTDDKTAEAALDSLGYTKNTYNKWLYKKVVDMDFFASNPGIFVGYIVSKLPFIIFFFLPIFALFIWLLYIRKPYTYMEHLIFTFHNQTMFFVLFSISMLLNSIFNFDYFDVIASIWFLIYLYKAMRHFYQQNRVKTFVKFFILNLIFIFLSVIPVLFSVIASFMIY
ncbi:MAG TPA: DUF3667 domain-containing protein [Salinimicrobium sp.]|nr:DUF3667 domain-containing protein [Salinimicrobium sp.]